MAGSNNFHIACSYGTAISFIMHLHGDETWVALVVTIFCGTFWFESMGQWERLGYNQGISKTDIAVLLERAIFIMNGNSWIANFSNKRLFFFLIQYMPLCRIPIARWFLSYIMGKKTYIMDNQQKLWTSLYSLIGNYLLF